MPEVSLSFLAEPYGCTPKAMVDSPPFHSLAAALDGGAVPWTCAVQYLACMSGCRRAQTRLAADRGGCLTRS